MNIAGDIGCRGGGGNEAAEDGRAAEGTKEEIVEAQVILKDTSDGCDSATQGSGNCSGSEGGGSVVPGLALHKLMPYGELVGRGLPLALYGLSHLPT